MRRMVAWRSDSDGGEQRRRARLGSQSDKATETAAATSAVIGFCIARYEGSLRRSPRLVRTPSRRLSPLVAFGRVARFRMPQRGCPPDAPRTEA